MTLRQRLNYLLICFWFQHDLMYPTYEDGIEVTRCRRCGKGY